MKNSFLALITVSTFALVGMSPAMAQSSTWTGTGTGLQEWSATGNWSGGTVPGGIGTTTNVDTATFNLGTAGTLVDIDAGRNVRNITFDTSAGTYTIGAAGANGGNALALTNGGAVSIATTFKGANIAETINAPLVLEPANATGAIGYTFTNNASAASNDALIFAGNISGGTTTGGVTLTLNGTNQSAINTISGNMSNGGASSFSLSLGGSAVWLLTGDNSGMTGGGTITLASGTTLLAGPTLLIGSNTALGSDTVNFNGSSQTGAPNFGAVGNIMVSNNFTNNSTSGETFVGSGNLTINGTFTNSKVTNTSLVNLATGTLTLGGTIYLTSGTSTSALFQMQGSGNTTFSGNILDSSSAGTGTKFLNFGSGTITISGNYGATGVFNDYGGTLVLDTSTTGNRLPNTALTLGGVTLDLSGGSSSSNQTVASTAIKVGQTIIQDTNSGTARINLGAITASSGGLVNFGANAASTSTANGSSGILGAAYTFGGTDWAISNGATTAISGYNGYTTFSEVNGSSTNYSLTGSGSIDASTAIQQGTLKINSSGSGQSLAMGSGASYTTTGLLYVGADDYSITGGTLNTTQAQLILQQWGAGKLTISSTIADRAGAVMILVKGGTGVLVLSGANNYTGVTDINAGTVSITSDSNLGGQNTTSVVSSSTGTTTVLIAAAQSDLVVGSSFMGSTITSISGTTVTLAGNANQTISSSTSVGFITSAANMTLNLNGGTLEADSTFSLAETLGTQTVNRSVLLGANGGTFDVSSGNTLTVAGTIGNLTNGDPGFTVSPMGALTKTDAGSLVLSGANTYTGTTTVKAGTLVAANTTGSATGTGALSVATGATLAGTGIVTSTNNTISGKMLVGQASTADVNTTSVLKMTASVATTFSGANLTFNLDTASTHSNTLDLGATSSVIFNGTNTLTFNLQGGSAIADGTQYLLFTDTNATNPFGGTGFSVDGNNKITGLNLVFDVNGTPIANYDGSYLMLSGSNIDLIVAAPEPGTWALMLGGIALLAIFQRSRRSKPA